MTHVCIPGLAQVLDSISSPRFWAFLLDIGDWGRHSAAILGDMKVMDASLCRLATRKFEGVGKRFTLAIIGSNPAAITPLLPEFHKVGNMWEGEILAGGEKRWTFRQARGGEAGEVEGSALRSTDV